MSKKSESKSKSGVPHGGIKRKAGKKAAPKKKKAAPKKTEARKMSQSDRAYEIRQDPILRGIQDVAISTRIAISNAAKALDYAETTLSDLATDSAKKVGESAKAAKRRAKEIQKAEKKLNRAIEEMKKVRGDLDSTLRGKG